MQTKSIKKQHRKYDAEFKRAALQQVQNGRSIADVAKSLGIGENLLYNWRAAQRCEMSGVDASAQSQIEDLRKQLRVVETERDILKKALLIFGRPT